MLADVIHQLPSAKLKIKLEKKVVVFSTTNNGFVTLAPCHSYIYSGSHCVRVCVYVCVHCQGRKWIEALLRL